MNEAACKQRSSQCVSEQGKLPYIYLAQQCLLRLAIYLQGLRQRSFSSATQLFSFFKTGGEPGALGMPIMRLTTEL